MLVPHLLKIYFGLGWPSSVLEIVSVTILEIVSVTKVKNKHFFLSMSHISKKSEQVKKYLPRWVRSNISNKKTIALKYTDWFPKRNNLK